MELRQGPAEDRSMRPPRSFDPPQSPIPIAIPIFSLLHFLAAEVLVLAEEHIPPGQPGGNLRRGGSGGTPQSASRVLAPSERKKASVLAMA